MKKRILIIAFSNLNIDSRVQRQINSLKEQYETTVIGWESPNIENTQFIKVSPPPTGKANKIKEAFLLITKQYKTYYKHKYENNFFKAINTVYTKNFNFDIIIANDIESLPIALKIKKNEKILVDLHEYSPLEFEDSLIWSIFFKDFKYYLCNTYLNLTDKIITVCDGISKKYEKEFNLKNIDVITNASPYNKTLQPTKVDTNKIKLIHHGIALESRHLEIMLNMMDFLDPRFTLDLILIPSRPKYLKKLKKNYSMKKNINFLDPVSPNNLIKVCNSYDLGIFVLPPVNFNYKYALPNKLFQFLQSRIGVIIGPSIEMLSILKPFNCYVNLNTYSPQKCAEILNKLTTKDIENLKKETPIAAKELNAEKNTLKLQQIVKSLS